MSRRVHPNKYEMSLLYTASDPYYYVHTHRVEQDYEIRNANPDFGLSMTFLEGF